MRHIRSFHRVANSGISSRIHRRLVANETSNLVCGSNIQWCGRSYSAPSNPLEAKKPTRKVSMDERISLIKNYVNRYKEMNAGKFPSASVILRNVGGSYYTVRKVLQEIIYYSNMPPTETTESVSLEKSSVKKDEVYTDSKQARQQKKLEHKSPISKVDAKDDISKSFESQKGLQSPILNQRGKPEVDGSQSLRTVNEPISGLHSDLGNSIKHETVQADKLNLDRLQPETELKESTKSDVHRWESPKAPTKEAEPPQKSSVWQSLRSFANGILGIWKKS